MFYQDDTHRLIDAQRLATQPLLTTIFYTAISTTMIIGSALTLMTLL